MSRKKEALKYTKRREKIVVPEPVVKEVVEKVDENVLFFGCAHVPFEHRNFLGFLQTTQEKFNCARVVCLGDLVDNNAISYHEKDPDGYTDGQEIDITKRKLEAWKEAFPILEITTSNHGDLPLRKALTNGLSKKRMRSDNDVYDLPDEWTWHDEIMINGIRGIHGTGHHGITANRQWMLNNMQKTVHSHAHTCFGLAAQASFNQLIWGMATGCGVDQKAFSMAYAKNNSRKFILGCSVLQEGRFPIPVHMDLGGY